MIILCISGLYGCQEDDLSVVHSYTSHTKGELVTKVPNVNKVKVHNGYLWFADTVAYKITLEKLQNYSREELDEWEKELGFTSIRYLFEKAVDEDEKYFKELESMTGEEKTKSHQSVAPSPHSAYVLNNSELFKFHDEGWFEIKIPLWTLHKVLNKDGVVRIGDKIKKYTSSAIKIVHDGDDKKVALLEDANESQPKKGIEVIEVLHFRYDITNTSSNAKLVDRDMQVNTCTNSVDRYRVRLYEDIVHYGLGNGTFEIVHGFRVYSFRRTIYGWERRFKTSALAGRVDYQASYGSGGQYIQANGEQHSIGWELATVQYGSFNEQYIYWSRGEAWGRNGCYCSYEESYP